MSKNNLNIKSGWPSGLRRQTQGLLYSPIVREHSGPRKRAWVQIPLLTILFSLDVIMFHALILNI